MWKILRLFFKTRFRRRDLPDILLQKLPSICEKEGYDINCVTFRRKSLFYFTMQYSLIDTLWGFDITTLEID